ncbi:MAG: 16S rRNA (guanine(527)-N(7))-methyltransferase RsmG [Myxococcales bacterium]|nr:16S rRNA (guanine(527)-N(7))-methyltransferase RsmG [Myxococcales bacterium]
MVDPSILESAAELGTNLSAEQGARLAQFVSLLLQANERANLTAVRDVEGAWRRHVLDSLSLCPFLPSEADAHVIDVGSGGGVPGLVLGIARPDLQFTLVDAIGKKVRLVASMARELDCSNVIVRQGRAETLARPGEPGREAYDAAVVRALAPMQVLLELVTPFVRPGGTVLAIKGERAAAELADAQRALAVLGCIHDASHTTPTGTIVRIRKRDPTPARYPRKPGEPKRRPLQ